MRSRRSGPNAFLNGNGELLRRRRYIYLGYLVLVVLLGVAIWQLIPPETLKAIKATYYDLGQESSVSGGPANTP